MAPRTDRIEARIDPNSADRIRYASALEQMSMSGFVVAAATEKAERVIAEHAYTLVPSDYFDRLLEVLDQAAEPMPELAAVARRERSQPRFRRA
ncbi:MAG: type II toxin-antitoxin system TacA family antitoxin [Solirubrobacteraceae bacterium]